MNYRPHGYSGSRKPSESTPKQWVDSRCLPPVKSEGGRRYLLWMLPWGQTGSSFADMSYSSWDDVYEAWSERTAIGGFEVKLQESANRNRLYNSYCCNRKVVSDSFMIPWAVAHQAPLSMEFSRQENWTGLPFPTLLLLLLLSRFSRVWLCNPIDCSPPGSPIPGILY